MSAPDHLPAPRLRDIAARIVVTGRLRLLTPAQIGNGDAEAITDMPLLLDANTGRPFLSGTSLAGALRGFLLAYERGYRRQDNRSEEINKDNEGYEGEPSERVKTKAELLFGGVKGDEYGEQSPLIVDDALAPEQENIAIELRDGVRIDYATRTAEDQKKYDFELLPADTSFDLRFELLLPSDTCVANALKAALRLALRGFEAQADLDYAPISLGGRKSRGFGRCVVDAWHVQEYDLSQAHDLLAWLAADHADWYPPQPFQTIDAIVPQTAAAVGPDQRQAFRIQARFDLDGAILIRSSEALTSQGEQPDAIHLRSHRNGRPTPIISGTSLAGVLRARATRILNTLTPDPVLVSGLLNDLFGTDMNGFHADRTTPPQASRLIVEERPIERSHSLVQNRVSIDRFTGGALDGALFAEAPEVGGDVELRFTLIQDQKQDETERDAQQGLLLLLLKDLWTSDLPIGGTSSIGRGRLKGRYAKITGAEDTWELTQSEERPTALTISGNQQDLEQMVKAVHRYLGRPVEHTHAN
jgi:CRISPR/Cas system CMR subunit Cmr4 (Cas7 group RAMP superfamily)